MKFSIEKQKLLSNIQHLYQIVPSKNTMPILTNYLIEADEKADNIKFTATDLEITVVAQFEANITEGGKVAVSARNLNDMINVLPDSMAHFLLEEDNLKIMCGNVKYNLHCAESSQFPLVPQKNLDNIFKMNAKLFKKMIDNTHFAVSTEINRPIFTGIYWKIMPDKQLMVATDGKKIAEFNLNNQVDIPEQIEQIIPTKGLLFLDKVFNEDHPDVSILIESNRVMFSYGNYTIFTHIIEGRFPDYTKAIPANNNNVLKIKKSILKDAVKRVSLLASEDTFKVKFDISTSAFSISSTKREEGDANENLEDFNYSGEPLVIAFNYRYLNSILNVLESDFIEIRMGKSNEPALFFNTDTDERYFARFLLMPLRLS
ncbi:MAG: DNA polymerase III subunit beta [Candidatus Cloacimonetes bacterium]|nr:DNA polymerase III subunit beta [Candidatus Cloacimonadota bacterium]MCF7813720.1 DNA polymerase III subunit beta [Candidatus Cloacimonadota bacterium]MCF7867786.1 DNA polymerase III subunit beta [Candidatus Cloacimonadota bacterium]MCF7883236.1 DNA polymerase III subunit beta [Candidatus Cloacimonadota bacterium]